MTELSQAGGDGPKRAAMLESAMTDQVHEIVDARVTKRTGGRSQHVALTLGSLIAGYLSVARLMTMDVEDARVTDDLSVDLARAAVAQGDDISAAKTSLVIALLNSAGTCGGRRRAGARPRSVTSEQNTKGTGRNG